MTDTPILHRDNPDKEPLVGNIKVTRDDWINAAMDVLISDGEARVKVAVLGERLGVSRSSFYWYFKSRADLLAALLEHWQGLNTGALVRQSERPAPTINHAVCNIFRCVIDPALFNVKLDFAIRDWARRAPRVRAILNRSEDRRLTALTDMFARYGYPRLEAIARARILYYMQTGYSDADIYEPMADRLALVPAYLMGFTGQPATGDAVAELRAYAEALNNGDTP